MTSQEHIVVICKDTQAATLLEILGVGLQFRSPKIDSSHSWYLAVQIYRKGDQGSSGIWVDLMIPHRDVALIVLNPPEKMMGFHANEAQP